MGTPFGFTRAVCTSCGNDKFYLEFTSTSFAYYDCRCSKCGKAWEAASGVEGEGLRASQALAEGRDEPGDLVSAQKEDG